MSRRPRIRRTLSALILALILSFVLEAQDSRKLYLVTGYPTMSGPQKVVSKLFRVDATRHDFEFVTELIAGEVGSLSTNVDHERRVVALISALSEVVS